MVLGGVGFLCVCWVKFILYWATATITWLRARITRASRARVFGFNGWRRVSLITWSRTEVSRSHSFAMIIAASVDSRRGIPVSLR